jgi:hypothetical protein
VKCVVEMSAERRNDGSGLGIVMMVHGSEDGTVMDNAENQKTVKLCRPVDNYIATNNNNDLFQK